jgi:maltose/moltooligosaccharide transporter
MGFYMGVFNFFIVIPQMIAAALLGLILKELFNSESIYALVIGGISMVIAGFMNFIVNDKGDESASEIIEETMLTEKTPTTYS